ncbi:unnamed protein product [Rotaria sp. Silwood2]|nr:unnamed protein product [Rotaria sp. Silwood2]CAF2919305.1 unnamed protein product [Rotaria sp. Silwood2]CAF3316372.1 unnamed protein product [Rotaria sp. Silwood2]CAF4517324.1 unnamed protein product [Rotaria sp. Silwood2]CAF4528653.1 unnamed protein product [Rotaria sp. Silwood2]
MYEITKKLPIAGIVTYADYELLSVYSKSMANAQYTACYDYERMFDLKCALNDIIYMIHKKVRTELNAIEQLSQSRDNNYRGRQHCGKI